jgi:hypothetical protein
MAKRTRHAPPSTNKPGRTDEVRISDYIAQAVNETEVHQSIYANHVQFTVAQNELYLDFYRIEPTPHVSNGPPFPVFLKRVIIPITLGKGFVNGLGNLIKAFENATNITLPNTREPQLDDEVDFWK